MESSNKPIGIFDSGLGGLTVARAISHALPDESIVYMGDTKRCPYGTRDQAEVRLFVRQVAAWLEKRDVKLVVIACNTATAAGLDVLQRQLSVPVIGVIEPGARAAVQATRKRRVGVLGTDGTVSSGSYERAITALDAGVEVVQSAASPLVDIVENELSSGLHLEDDWKSNPEIFDKPEYHATIAECVAPLVAAEADTVVLGCTHFPLIETQIAKALGEGVTLVSSAQETCREVRAILKRRGEFADPETLDRGVEGAPKYLFATTSDDITAFAVAGRFVFGHQLDLVEHIVLDELEALTPADATGYIPKIK